MCVCVCVCVCMGVGVRWVGGLGVALNIRFNFFFQNG